MKKLFRWFLTIALIFVAVIENCAAQVEEDLLHVYFIDVGQADAAIITCKDMVLMIDGGNAADSSLIYSMLRNTLNIDHIDYMIATHPHADHVGGLAGVLNACTVDVIYTPVLDYDTDAFHALLKYAQLQGSVMTVPSTGNSFYIGDACVEILGPSREYSDINDMSIISKITYGGTSFLFMGDAGWDSEHDMVDAEIDLTADVLKVGHHGSDTSTSYVFLRAVMPTYAVISCGKGNPYGHPTEAVLSRLSDADVIIYSTDEDGTIECVSDGNEIWFSTEND